MQTRMELAFLALLIELNDPTQFSDNVCPLGIAAASN
jgi:hypothetical protein